MYKYIITMFYFNFISHLLFFLLFSRALFI